MALRELHRIEGHEVKKIPTEFKLQWAKFTRKTRKNRSFCWMYEGQVMRGENHGYGVLTKVYKHGAKQKCYSGHWKNGKMQGLGGHWDDDGGYYEGNFDIGKRSGFGRMWHNDGNLYQGFWKDDLYNGNGMLIYANGNRYEGDFLNGKKSGRGTFYHLRTGQMQEGHWKFDICVESIIVDIGNRQSAPEPTSYPIQILNT